MAGNLSRYGRLESREAILKGRSLLKPRERVEDGRGGSASSGLAGFARRALRKRHEGTRGDEEPAAKLTQGDGGESSASLFDLAPVLGTEALNRSRADTTPPGRLVVGQPADQGAKELK
jgi:hypothetical protein